MHTGERTVTIGSIPSDEWPAGIQRDKVAWLDSNFEQQIHRAVLFGAGLKEIGRAAEEIAIRYAIDGGERECSSRGVPSWRH